MHTTASDGALAPEAVVKAAAQAGMTIISITDHDTIGGVNRALAAGERTGLPMLSGIELSTGETEEVHILGYGVRPGDEALHAFLSAQMVARRERMLTMLDRLRALEKPVEPEDMEAAEDGFAGRLNLARAMARRGYVASAAEAFARYLSPGKPAYVPRARPTVPAGIEALRRAGSVVSLAHPGRLSMDAHTLGLRLPGWIEAGLQGIEAYHSSHTAAQANAYARLARRQRLLTTGGSDFHGMEGGAQIGCHLRHWRTVKEDVAALLACIGA